MTNVICPVCERRINGEGTAELDRNLREHFSADHDIDVQKESGKFGSPMTESTGGKATTHGVHASEGRLHKAEIRREEQAWAPDEESIPPRPKGVGDWVKKSLGIDQKPEEDEAWVKGEGYPELIGGERGRAERKDLSEDRASGAAAVGEVSVACPLCGERTVARDEDALSTGLREHMGTVHQIVPRMAQRAR